MQSYHCSMAIGTGQVEGSPIKAIKKNTFESVLMRWMKLEPIIQSEISQKEKKKKTIQYTNAYIWNKAVFIC